MKFIKTESTIVVVRVWGGGCLEDVVKCCPEIRLCWVGERGSLGLRSQLHDLMAV